MATVDRPGRTTEEELAELAPLHDPVRRALYLYVAAQPHEVGRDEAAAAVGVSRRLAAFHLDKLVEGGFLEPSFRRLGGRTGPGAGRPSKLYAASAEDRIVSLPRRDYHLAAELFAEALLAEGDVAGPDSLRAAARKFGHRFAAAVTARLGGRPSEKRRRAALTETLGSLGYQPYGDDADVRLRNCPFRALAEQHTELVCGMNLSLLEGVVEGLDGARLAATRRHDAVPSGCCVVIEATGPR